MVLPCLPCLHLPPQMLDIASMTLFLMMLDCRYFAVPDSLLGYNQVHGG